MVKLHYETTINAPAQKIWEVLFSDDTYSKWTQPFAEGSYAETDWKEGSKVLFLTPDKNGMASRIKKSQPNKFMSFEHLGEVKKGIEDYESERVKQWAGSTENYTLDENNGVTKLSIDMDTLEGEFQNYLEKTWPIALGKVKELAEK